MKIFKANSFQEKEITLRSLRELKRFYAAVENNEEFVVTWKDGGFSKSRLVVANDLVTKIKNGDFVVYSETPTMKGGERK